MFVLTLLTVLMKLEVKIITGISYLDLFPLQCLFHKRFYIFKVQWTVQWSVWKFQLPFEICSNSLMQKKKKPLKWKDSAVYKFKFWFMNLAVSLYQLKTCIEFFNFLQTTVITELVCFVSRCQGLALPQPGNLPLHLSKPSVERADDKESKWQSKIVHTATFKCLERLSFHVLTVQFQL